MKPPVCPCGSGLRFTACCKRLHAGTVEADSAEALMRSRFAAYAVADVDYLWRTLHPDHVDKARPRDEVVAALRSWCRQARFPGLQILEVTSPDGDGPDAGTARVLFRARVFVGSRDCTFVECSSFRHDGVGWRYLEGEPDARPEVVRGVQTMAAFAARAPAPPP
jgi:SEC-C motif-containing protein